MEYKLSPSLTSQSPAAGFQPHASSESGRKMKGRDMRWRAWERGRKMKRERSAGIGGRQTSKMKKGEGRRMKGMTMNREDEDEEEGRKKGKWRIGVRGRVITNAIQIGGEGLGSNCSPDVWWPTDYPDGPSRRYRSRGTTSSPPSEGWSWDFGYWNNKRQFCISSNGCRSKNALLENSTNWNNNVQLHLQVYYLGASFHLSSNPA